MTTAQLEPGHSGPEHDPTRRRSRDISALPVRNIVNDRFAALVVAVPVLAAWPNASNRPIIWAIWGVVVSALALLFYATALRERPQLRCVQFPLLLLSGFGMILWAGVQILPLGLTPDAPLLFAELPTISVDPDAGALALTRLLTYGLLFVLVTEVATRETRIRWMLKVLFAGALAQAIFSLLALNAWADFAPWGTKEAYLGFATGSFINRNSLAMYLGMGASIGFALALDLLPAPAAQKAQKDKKGPPEDEWRVAAAVWLVGTAVILAAVFATGSRMGLLSQILGLACIYVTMRLKAGQNPFGVALRLMAVGGPLVAVMMAIYGTGTLDRGIDLLAQPFARQELWAQTLPMIADRWVTGFGLDTFELAFRPYHRAGLDAGLIWDSPHSTYLSLWVELGVIAGSLPMICVLMAVRNVWRNYRQRARSALRTCVAFGVVVQCGVHATVDFGLETQANVLLFIVIMGLGTAVTRKRASE